MPLGRYLASQAARSLANGVGECYGLRRVDRRQMV